MIARLRRAVTGWLAQLVRADFSGPWTKDHNP